MTKNSASRYHHQRSRRIKSQLFCALFRYLGCGSIKIVGLHILGRNPQHVSTFIVVRVRHRWGMPTTKCGNFTQLTLFPRVSETSETNLRIQGTPFREHLVEHGFFQYAELVILTLMKGDERVEAGQIAADLTLFIHVVWQRYSHILDIGCVVRR